MKQAIISFLREEEALTTVEYAVAGGLISAAVVGAFTALGSEVGRIISGLAGVLSAISIG